MHCAPANTFAMANQTAARIAQTCTLFAAIVVPYLHHILESTAESVKSLENVTNPVKHGDLLLRTAQILPTAKHTIAFVNWPFCREAAAEVALAIAYAALHANHTVYLLTDDIATTGIDFLQATINHLQWLEIPWKTFQSGVIELANNSQIYVTLENTTQICVTKFPRPQAPPVIDLCIFTQPLRFLSKKRRELWFASQPIIKTAVVFAVESKPYRTQQRIEPNHPWSALGEFKNYRALVTKPVQSGYFLPWFHCTLGEIVYEVHFFQCSSALIFFCE